MGSIILLFQTVFKFAILLQRLVIAVRTKEDHARFARISHQLRRIIDVVLVVVENLGPVLIIGLYHHKVELIVTISLFCTIICAKLIGCTLPMAAKRLHADPALMASPMLTTIVDALSLTIYFTIAGALITFTPAA